MQIEQNVIDDILRRTDIVELISKSVKLKKSGPNYFACCPFHNEKTPSFSVNSVKQIFHCFGCSESGNAITFLMKNSGYDFLDAVKILAHDAGVYIPEKETKFKISKEEYAQKKKDKLSLQETLHKVVTVYKNNLLNDANASNYLKKRGLNSNIINKFAIGFTPNLKNPLERHFDDYSQNKFLIDAGLVIKNENNTFYERFRNRIIFPIKNSRGELIGFGGRIIDQGEPKYLNSPETTLFNKSNELYGLFEAQKNIYEKKFVIVVEGYMDVVALAQFGVENVVASMGTAATTEHIKKLFRLSDDIYFCFDGDKAGQRAAVRALDRSIELVTDLKTVHFCFLPEEHDPDSFIRQNGGAKFDDELKNNSLSITRFLFSELVKEVNLTKDEGRAKLITIAKPYIERTKAVALQVLLKEHLASLVNLAPNVIESILNNRSRYAFYNSRWNKNQVVNDKPSNLQINNVERIITLAINNIEWLHHYCLPETIDSYSIAIRELILVLDYISTNFNQVEDIKLNLIQENISFKSIDIIRAYNSKITVNIDREDFYHQLDYVFGFIRSKGIKIPKIPMRSLDKK